MCLRKTWIAPERARYCNCWFSFSYEFINAVRCFFNPFGTHCQKWRSFPKPVKFVFMFLRYWKRHLILLRKKVFFASASWLFFFKRERNSWARQNFLYSNYFFVAAKMINKKKRGNYFWYFKTYLCRAQSSKRVVQAVTWTAVTSV